MQDKSYVTMEQRHCITCGKHFDTGAVLLDKRLEPKFERHTCTRYGTCPECMVLINQGMVALVEVDPAKSKVEDKALTGGAAKGSNGSITPDNAHCTGRMMWVKRTDIKEDFRPPADCNLVYVEPGLLDIIANNGKEIPHPTVQ